MIQIQRKQDSPLFNYFAGVCEKYSGEPYPQGMDLDRALVKYVGNFCTKVGAPAAITNLVDAPITPVHIANNPAIILAFSGGKDGTAVALMLKERGVDVTLYHMLGINRTYMGEVKNAEAIAARLGVPLIIDRVKITGKQRYPDHPFKNQLILAAMVDLGVKVGVNRYAMGNHSDGTVQEANVALQFSDMLEQTELFDGWVRKYVPQYSRETYLRNNMQALDRVLQDDPTLLPLISSCVTPAYRKPMMRKHIEAKYGADVLLAGRCGYCLKCTKEYMVLATKGVLRFSNDFYEHCRKQQKKAPWQYE